jgi:hypothetical protein
MGRSRGHGHRRHIMSGVCNRKGSAYTTYDAAMSAVARTKDAIRAYRGDCCGYYHITRYTEDEYAQRCATYYDEALCTDVDPNDIVGANNTTMSGEHDEIGVQPSSREGDAGTTQVKRSDAPRLAPSPATLARQLQARRNP